MLVLLFTNRPRKDDVGVPAGETNHAGGERIRKRKRNIMGDKSPKSVKKQATQKQTKTSGLERQKKEAAAAKQVAGKKK
jgi:hypothetical protein